MKNLTKLIGSIGLAGVLSLGGCGEEEKKSPYDVIAITSFVNDEGLTDKIVVGGTKKGDNCAWSGIYLINTDSHHFLNKISLYTHIKRDEARCKELNYNKAKNTFSYKEFNMKHSLDNCDWIGEPEKIKNFEDNLELRYLAENILDLNETSCNDDWKFFLTEEIKENFSDSYLPICYQISFSKIDKNRFPKSIWASVKTNSNKILSTLGHEDTDNDNFYDKIELLINKTPLSDSVRFEEEQIIINPKNMEIKYFGRNLTSLKIQERAKKILDVEINCKLNKQIDFLYSEYDKLFGKD